jgi:hypothetical protein
MVLAITSAVSAVTLAWHYPFGGSVSVIVVLLLSAIMFWQPWLWLLLIPGLLPLIGGAPWTGWLTFEEFDLLVLTAAGAGYARLAYDAYRPAKHLNSSMEAAIPPAIQWPLFALFGLSTLWAIGRGFDDAGGFAFSWYQGYREPMNSVRLAKAFLFALLFLPIWLREQQHTPNLANRVLLTGTALGLTGVSILTIWERTAFVGLLNFSADYRTTALFWEMHVGGAALDGYLALTLPFAVLALTLSKTRKQWLLAGIVLVLASYACLTTFSRGLYAAVPVGLLVFVVLQARQVSGEFKAQKRFLLRGALLVVGFGLSAAWMFAGSGYRGLLAQLGCMALLLPISRLVRPLTSKQVASGVALGATTSVLALLVVLAAPRGAYVVYGLAAIFSASIIYVFEQERSSQKRVAYGVMALAGVVSTIACTALVANRWGGQRALLYTTPALFIFSLLLSTSIALRKGALPLWPDSFRWQGAAIGSMAMAAAMVSVFSGGAYMGDRFDTGSKDLNNRVTHWRQGLQGLITQSDWLFGRGMGRFPGSQIQGDQANGYPGDYRLVQQHNESYLALSSGKKQDMGYDELFRVSQRVAVPVTPLRMSARVRSEGAANILFEVCEKHLLYKADCLVKEVQLASAPGKWQTVLAEVTEGSLSRGDWYAPRQMVFSFALRTPETVVQIDDLIVVGPDGINLLTNGDFKDGLARWFSSSDRNHLPWHVKNIFLNVLFDQGIAGLAIWLALVATTLTHLVKGAGKEHPLAPAIVASMIGFVTVGLFDSLLDVPRVGMLCYFIMMIGLTIKGPMDFEGSTRPLKAGKESIAPYIRRSEESRNQRRYMTAPVGTVSTLVVLFALTYLAWPQGRTASSLRTGTPGELLRHIKQRLEGHELFESALLPLINGIQKYIEHPPPSEHLPTLGKGQQSQALALQQFDSRGKPIAAALTPDTSKSKLKVDYVVTTPAELKQALETVRSGQVIELAAGTYAINFALETRGRGTALEPITLRSPKPGDALIELDTVEGFHVIQPYWIFENLVIHGVCKEESDCEHAFHVTGAASGVVIRNNLIKNFNAHIKVNGDAGQWPDGGLLQFNTLTNEAARRTKNPVTLFDLVGANHWVVADNLVTNFVKIGSNRISYGLFMKGAGTGGRFERNLVVCTPNEISQPGVRVGISWGGGTTGPAFCRDGLCANEYSQGIASNNVVAHCNDAGIDINHSQQISLIHNTLINTAGINVRGKSSDVRMVGNLLDGRIRVGIDSNTKEINNDAMSLGEVLQDPDRLQLAHKLKFLADVPITHEAPTDFFNRQREHLTWTGAVHDK